MFKTINISAKITTLVLGVVILTVFAVSFIAFTFSQRSIEDRYFENLRVITDVKAGRIEDYLSQAQKNTALLRDMPQVRQSMAFTSDIYNAGQQDSILMVIGNMLDGYLPVYQQNYGFSELLLTTDDGLVMYSAGDSLEVGSYYKGPSGWSINTAAKEAHWSNITLGGNGEYMLVLGQPVGGGVLVAFLPMEPIYDILTDYSGLGNTGEAVIGREENGKVEFLSQGRQQPNLMDRTVNMGAADTRAMQAALGQGYGSMGAARVKDYDGNEVLGSWQRLQPLGWGLVVKIETEEIYEEATGLLVSFYIAGGVVTLLAFMIGIIFSRFLVRPILSLRGTLQLLGRGVLPERVERKTNDEVGQMADRLDELVQALKRTASFAHKIGEGHFDADFEPMSEQDTLGTALISMRDSIQESEKKDSERNWIVTGEAEIGQILRSHNDLEQLGDEILAFVTNKINGIQAAFYVLNEDDKDDVFLEMKASYAYNKKKYLEARFKFAEGLVGQAAIEQDTILRTEIPDDYVTITSGLLGDRRPRCLLIVPLITDEKVYGVLEFAGFDRFSPTEVKFVQQISVIIARTIFNISVNERTRRLLEDSQALSTELQEQQEVLRQNAEEMESTQEELKRTNQRLEDQIEEVNRTQKRMQLLLENASEVITIYEADGVVRYISPSVEKILGYTQNEMIGHRDMEYVKEDYIETVEEMFTKLLGNPEQSVTIQYEYESKHEGSLWVEATGTNRLNDPAVKGIIVNLRDITERRRAEQEQRMRSQMQALSENSPDLITRMDVKGNVFYINPVIETYTGKKPAHFLNSAIGDSGINHTIVGQWMDLLAEVLNLQEKMNREMDFPSEIGDRIMQVNAIPEFSDDSHLESILMVSHDITERKLIELEIQSKNKKITESINYAKRIQGAILPDNSVIQKVLPKSFILYKARDVVSGDFPWYLQVGDELFLAAVDCTGHGVPGALISLIGYFLLNDIVRSRKVHDPGIILDLLDENVTKTLRQDEEDSKTKDGMDIALTKINVKKKTVEYAGAHRPLYFMKDGELQEVKGNKFPIGGGRYKNQTNFTNTVIQLAEGDSFFFCSDGFPDQFGGPENRKFGPRRLRNMIRETAHLNMEGVYESFETEWEGWKGETKQTDDVLMIGVRF